jgi:hypothetical protein
VKRIGTLLLGVFSRHRDLRFTALGCLPAGDHYADELEDHLDDFLVEELHVECEDGSPAEVHHMAVYGFVNALS